MIEAHVAKVQTPPGSARVNLVDVDGHTVLHWAALGGNAEVCQILMENGISPNVQVGQPESNHLEKMIHLFQKTEQTLMKCP